MDNYSVARLDEMEEIDDGREPYRAVRHHLGITAFGVTAWTGRSVGDRILNEHDEADTDTGDRNEELYLVLEGRARFELDGEPVDAAAGTFVFVEPDVKRTAFAEEAGTTIVAVGATAGKPYQAVGWELWSPIRPRYEAGEHEAVVEALTPARRGQSRVPAPRLQPRLRREPHRPSGRGAPAPPPGNRGLGLLPRLREERLGPRRDPRGARVPRARRRLTNPPVSRTIGRRQTAVSVIEPGGRLGRTRCKADDRGGSRWTRTPGIPSFVSWITAAATAST